MMVNRAPTVGSTTTMNSAYVCPRRNRRIVRLRMRDNQNPWPLCACITAVEVRGMLLGSPQMRPVRKVALVVTSTKTLGSVQVDGGELQSTVQGVDWEGLHCEPSHMQKCVGVTESPLMFEASLVAAAVIPALSMALI